MSARSLSTLLHGAGVVPLDPLDADPLVSGVRVDSRDVRPGDLFFALKGSREDGVRHAPEAVRKGAVAIVAEQPAPEPSPRVPWVRVERSREAMGLLAREWFGRPDEGMTLVGVTGTKGKTTVAYFVESIAKATGRRAGRIGTVSYAYAGGEVSASRTTPEATEFYELLAKMRSAGTEWVAVEVSSHALALHRVEGARFPIAAFLNLGHDHLDFHGSPEAYFESKAALFDRLGPADSAVLPADDPLGDALAARTRGRVISFGRSKGANVRIVEERADVSGSTVRLGTPHGPLELRVALPGRFNVSNAAAAAACAIALDVEVAAIVAGVGGLLRVPGRLERVTQGQPFAVLVDYAHTPESLGEVLSALRELTSGRLVVVFGCGGDRDRGKRFEMGRAAAELADRIVLTSDNPRGEDPMAILRAVDAGLTSVPGAEARRVIEPDRGRAILAAVSDAAPGDTVVIAGKGHETTQTFAGRVEPFDDRQVARRALATIGFTGESHAGA